MSSLSVHEKFRNDINALRAWAVFSVVMYHFGIPGFSGGYSGVDVFFVISGYLMTGIVVSGLNQGQFSLVQFYAARIKRIIPALAFMCLCLIVLGWVLLAPDDYRKLAEHVKDTLLFVSNETYRKESGYFDVESHNKWLLHTWSLSVEWQFYLALPIVILVSWKISKGRRWAILVFLILISYSFISCILKSGDAPTKAFYIVKYRYWEMLVGGLVYILKDLIKINHSLAMSRSIYLLALACVVFPVYFLSPVSDWPGWWTAIPVLGAAAFIFISVDTLLSKQKAVYWLGSRSYSIYLWHWPVVALLVYFQRIADSVWIIFGLVISLLLSELSFRFVENPFRKANDRGLIAGIIFCSALVWGAAHLISYNKGFPSRVDPIVQKIAEVAKNKGQGGHDCIYGKDRAMGPLSCDFGSGELKAIVIGDSHASALVSAVQAALPDANGKVQLWARAACPFIVGATAKIDQDCREFTEWVFDQLRTTPENIPVIVITRTSLYAIGANEGVAGSGKEAPPIYFDKIYSDPAPEFLDQFRQHAISTICDAAANRSLYWLKPIPELKVSVPQIIARAKMQGRNVRVSIPVSEYRERHAFVMSVMSEAISHCGVHILDPLPYLCDKESCYGDTNGWPIYFDDDHLSDEGNKVLVPVFKSIFSVETRQ